MKTTTAEKIAVMQAYDEGKKIKTEFDFGTSTTFLVKNIHGELEWDWKHCDYEIVEEPKQVPFDVSDYELLLGSKIKGIDAEISGICIEVREDGVTVGKWDIDYRQLYTNYEIYNELINKWLPCTKATNKQQ